ncbi:hypothetical protein BCR34DRAFT_625896 [Clohesyomyces aquaticus]|uniref:NB-ARC domain-containing protein n=1 Tax=Clohesyomyces aquaticus TaxID=1231657 RepID=A0A1Y1ZG27_9PLEO|nr:hypothetical protein BCR34DRAFT_625896 [Clohesyomyces aquaticus]
MPLIYGEGEEHALSRLKEIANIRDPQSLQTASFNVPFRRDCDFVDRGDILSRVDERCSRPAGRAALVGVGGFGKSQLAIEYAHRMRKQRPATWVFWVHASNSARLEQAFSDIAERVGLCSQPGAAIDTVPAVCRWLSNEANGRWLIIVDNVDDEITIESQEDGQSIPLASLLPQSDHGAVVITSRNANVARSLVGRQQDIIKISAISDSEAVELLRNKLGDEPSEGATQLVNALDCIPLAIVQAAAYINRLGQRMSIPKYLGQLKGVEGRVELLQKAAPDIRRDGKALNSHIRQQRPSAADLLSFMSFFNPQSIPKFMIRHYTDNNNNEQDNSLERQTNEDNNNFKEDVAVLRAFSLVNTKQCKDEFKMHRLVQLATRAFTQAMAHEFPDGEYANWPKLEQKEPCIREANTWSLLLNNTEGIVSKALRIQRQTLGSDASSTLLSSSLLDYIMADLGKYSEAKSMHRQTLATKEKVLGVDHPDTLTTMNNLALVLGRQGKYSEAESMHRQTLATSEKVLGVDHPDTLATMNNLAEVLSSQGKYLEAESMHRQTLATKEKVLGVDHPSTLTTMNNLAEVLSSQGKYSEAKSMHRQTLASSEKVLGVDHPSTLTTMNNLAEVLSSHGKYLEAESMHRQTLATKEKVLGVDHPSTLTTMNNLAEVLSSQGKYSEAKSMHRQTLATSEKVLGVDHPSTLATMNNLAEVLSSHGNQGKYLEAESMHRQTLATKEKVLGVDHPDTLTTMNNLAEVLSSQGKYSEAKSMHRQTLATKEKVLGVDHPYTLTSVYCLAYHLASRHRYDESTALYERACAGYNTTLGKDHPTTRACHQHYAQMRMSQSRFLQTLHPIV